MNRATKQLVIGSIYMTIFGLFMFGAYWNWFKPIPTCFDTRQNQNETGVDCGGVCISCALKYPKALEVVSKKILPVAASRSDVLVQIKNPNLTVGAGVIEYHIALRGHVNELLEERDGTTFVYPGKLKYVYESGFGVGATNVSSIEFKVINAEFLPEEQFYFKDLIASNVRLEKQGGSFRIIGTARNNGDLTLDELYVTGLVFDHNKRNVVAVSKTLLRTILGREQRFFEISFPESLLQFVPLTEGELVEIELAAPPLQR